MLELNRHNRPVKVTNQARRSATSVLMIPNAAALPVAEVPASGLPARSLPRIMNPSDVPMTDAASFVAPAL